MAPEHRDCISDLHTVIAPRIITKRTTRGLTSVGADSVDHGINSVQRLREGLQNGGHRDPLVRKLQQHLVLLLTL